ncbi:MAG: B12-binding domain-containing protein [Bacillota bacterium]
MIDNFDKIFVRYDLRVSKKMPPSQPLSDDLELQEIIDSVIKGDPINTAAIVKYYLETKEPMDIIYKALIPAMNYVSKLWEEKVYYLPQTMNASDAMQVGLEMCEKKMGKAIEKKGLVITHTAEGDLHDLGQKIVNALLRAQGYEVLDLGNDVPVQTVVDAVKKHKPIMLTGTAGLTVNVDAFNRISRLLSREGIEIPFACGGGGGVSMELINFRLGIYGKDAKLAPPMAEDARKGLNWEEIKQKYS